MPITGKANLFCSNHGLEEAGLVDLGFGVEGFALFGVLI
jgi:hypothetical protein